MHLKMFNFNIKIFSRPQIPPPTLPSTSNSAIPVFHSNYTPRNQLEPFHSNYTPPQQTPTFNHHQQQQEIHASSEEIENNEEEELQNALYFEEFIARAIREAGGEEAVQNEQITASGIEAGSSDVLTANGWGIFMGFLKVFEVLNFGPLKIQGVLMWGC
jgi:hypothetical protein